MINVSLFVQSVYFVHRMKIKSIPIYMPRYMHNNNKQLMINVLSRNSQIILDLPQNLLHCGDDS